MQNRTRLPVPRMPPAAPESAIERSRSGAEQRARTTAVATLAAAQNGTSGVLAQDDLSVTSNLTFGPRIQRARPVVVGALRVGGPAAADYSDELFCVWVCRLAIKAHDEAR
jgi:hypothetical protein